jgi:Xaa-Pro dipeptidase
VGVNEREVAAEVYRSMVLGGSEYPGFAPLVRSTDVIGQEHATWRDRVLAPGDTLLLELSASVRRYHAPITRVVHLGRSMDGVDEAGEIALEGLETVCDALRPGAITGDVYAAWQRVVDRALGPGRYQRHHCGYTVGIGFPPSWVGGSTVVGIRPGGQIEVREGMAFHVLSWLLGVGPADYGVSDTVVVTADGGELLTSTARKPVLIA